MEEVFVWHAFQCWRFASNLQNGAEAGIGPPQGDQVGRALVLECALYPRRERYCLIESLENGLGFVQHGWWRVAIHYLK